MAQFTRPQGEALRSRIVDAFQRSPQHPPTHQELADELRVRVNTITYHERLLIRDGILIKEPGIARGVRLSPDWQRRQHTTERDHAIVTTVRAVYAVSHAPVPFAAIRDRVLGAQIARLAQRMRELAALGLLRLGDGDEYLPPDAAP